MNLETKLYRQVGRNDASSCFFEKQITENGLGEEVHVSPQSKACGIDGSRSFLSHPLTNFCSSVACRLPESYFAAHINSLCKKFETNTISLLFNVFADQGDFVE